METYEQTQKTVVGVPLEKKDPDQLWVLIEILGWILLIPCLLAAVVALIQDIKLNNELTGTGLSVCFGILLFAAVGRIVVLAARKGKIRWVCSVCGNQLTHKDAKICAVCRAELS